MAYAASRRKPFNWFRLVSAVLIAGCIVMVVVAFSIGQHGEKKLPLPTGVAAVFPEPGQIERRQAEIGVVLEDGFDGALVIDGVRIPEDQVRRDRVAQPETEGAKRAGGGTIAYSARKGTEFEELAAGSHTVEILYWPVDVGETTSSQAWRWTIALS